MDSVMVKEDLVQEIPHRFTADPTLKEKVRAVVTGDRAGRRHKVKPGVALASGSRNPTLGLTGILWH